MPTVIDLLGLLQLFVARGSGTERGSTPLFGPRPGTQRPYYVGLVNSTLGIFVPRSTHQAPPPHLLRIA